MANTPGVDANSKIGTLSQSSLDGILNGAEEMALNCTTIITGVKKKIEEFMYLKNGLVDRMLNYCGEKRSELVDECRIAIQEYVNSLKDYVDGLLADMKDWKKTIDDELNAIKPEVYKEIDAKMVTPMSDLYNKLGTGDKFVYLESKIPNSDASTDALKEVSAILTLIAKLILQPYNMYNLHKEWWDINGPKITTHMNKQIEIIDAAILTLTELKKQLDQLAASMNTFM